MTANNETSRRQFLTTSAKIATAAGLIGTGSSATAAGSKLQAVAGPKPERIKEGAPIRLGLIGVGGRCSNLVNASAKAKSNIEIKAIADPSEVNVKRMLGIIGKNWNNKPDVYSGEQDYKTKLLPRDDLDAVLIATPCCWHAEMYLAAFAAGKHFYGEKPMCIELDEVNAIVTAQEKNPEVLCQIGFQRRASAGYQAGVKALHDGKCGDLFEALGGWRISGGPLGLPNQGTRVWFGRRKMSGDWMLEQACHTWDVFCWVAGDMPVAATGRGRRGLFKHIDPERDVTDFYVAHLEFPNGMIADFEHNWMCPKHDNKRLFNGIFERFTGPKGGVAFSTWKNEAEYYPRDGRQKVEKFAENVPEPTQESITSFYNALRTNTKTVSNVQNGRLATLTGMLVRKAVYEQRRVTMKEMLKSAPVKL